MVLGILMGGGHSFSAGGPGKGMHSRLFINLLNKYHFVNTCAFVHLGYHKTGLIGILISGDSSQAQTLVDIASKEIEKAATKLTLEEVQRSKNAAFARIQMLLESKAAVCVDIGLSILGPVGRRPNVSEVRSMIEKITPLDIQTELVQCMKTPITVAISGRVQCVTKYDVLDKTFK